MRIYIITNDGITLCREPPAELDEREIVVSSNDELHAAQLMARPMPTRRPSQTRASIMCPGAAIAQGGLETSRPVRADIRPDLFENPARPGKQRCGSRGIDDPGLPDGSGRAASLCDREADCAGRR
jgi:hypothetical protein